MDSVVDLFVVVDDFWQVARPIWHRYLLKSGERQRIRASRLSESEIMTIVILFHNSNYRHFKAFYTEYLCVYHRKDFPNLVSYERFVALMPRVGVLLYVFLRLSLGRCTGISFVDSTPLKVCHPKRINRHRVFRGLAERGKTSMGWFYGFKLHLVINDRGELLDFELTPGNVDDRHPVPKLAQRLFGKLFGDKGYISAQLRDDLRDLGLEFITTLRRNMKVQLLPLLDKLLLRRRSLIETVNGQLKEQCQIEHTRHRSPNNFFVNLMAGLIAYCRKPNKPQLQLDANDYQMLATSQPQAYP